MRSLGVPGGGGGRDCCRERGLGGRVGGDEDCWEGCKMKGAVGRGAQ